MAHTSIFKIGVLITFGFLTILGIYMTFFGKRHPKNGK